ncbi:lipid A deacylase LpxR family protein [Thiomicrorhabdus sp.]|uniref:lipid A deacylase LpxR family protein n=1 Tax=Thiomicrorhabdus sp. TaxID=2039724 RepID=UPI0029C810A0|nr:lipid A deacylase LpxR family protein [Thiomicrorhabdus sp.]
MPQIFSKPFAPSMTIAACCLFGQPTLASNFSPKGIFNFTLENDVFYGTDRNYTNGVKFIWIPENRDQPPVWASRIATLIPWFPQSGRLSHGYAFGQSLFTPDDIRKANPPLEEQPYAAWLYASIGLAAETNRRLDQVTLTAGMIGPAALGRETQTLVHQLIGSDTPRGWHTQLANETGFFITSKRTWRKFLTYHHFGNSVDIAPYMGNAFGNVFTYANAGITFRYGKSLPDDYGPPRLQPGRPNENDLSLSSLPGWYLYAGLEARAVLRNIFLDGNTFSDSRRVDKYPFVGDLQFGFVLDWQRYRLSYTHVLRSPEYRQQQTHTNFGAVTLGIRF